jgi:pyruvate dehydrogenase E1 component
MEGLFGQVGIYSSRGQLYNPGTKTEDNANTPYIEKKDGQLLEEGINEAGSMADFIAAGTANVTYGVPTIPFYIYYSMFGFQRVGDQVWLAGDSRCRGFMIGATARDSSIRTPTVTWSPPRFPTCTPMSRPSATNWRSSSAMA